MTADEEAIETESLSPCCCAPSLRTGMTADEEAIETTLSPSWTGSPIECRDDR